MTNGATKSMALILLFLLMDHSQENRCNIRLLQSFHLRGRKYSSFDPMHICPMVYERCCSIVDELTILQMWNSHGLNAVRHHVATFFANFQSLVEASKFLTQFDKFDMTTHYINTAWIPYFHRVVEDNSIPRPYSSLLRNKEFRLLFPG